MVSCLKLIAAAMATGLLLTTAGCASTDDTNTPDGGTVTQSTGAVAIFTPSDGITLSQHTPLNKWAKLVPDITSELKKQGFKSANITTTTSSDLAKQSQDIQDYVVNHAVSAQSGKNNANKKDGADEKEITLIVAPAAETQTKAKRMGLRAPVRSSHRPAPTAKKAGKSATQESIAPTAKGVAPWSIASSVAVKRMPVVHPCMMRRMKKSLRSRTLRCTLKTFESLGKPLKAGTPPRGGSVVDCKSGRTRKRHFKVGLGDDSRKFATARKTTPRPLACGSGRRVGVSRSTVLTPSLRRLSRPLPSRVFLLPPSRRASS